MHNPNLKESTEHNINMLNLIRKKLREMLVIQLKSAFSTETSMSINELRKDVQKIKYFLAKESIKVENLPEDGEDFHINISSFFDLGASRNIEDLLSNQLYKYYIMTDSISRFVNKLYNSPGYYLINSDTAKGKTALMLHIYRTLQTSNRNVAACFFSREHNPISIRDAINLLSSQLLKFLNMQKNTSISNDDTPTTLRELLEISAENGHRPLLLIDGFDELHESERKINPNSLFPLISSKPKNDNFSTKEQLDITIVVSTRNSASDNLLQYLHADHPLQYTTAQEIPSLKLDDIKKIITKRNEDIDPSIDLLSTARDIEKHSHGNSLFIINCCYHLWNGKTNLEEMLKTTQNKRPMDIFHNNTLQNIEASCRSLPDQEVLQKVLSVLSIAYSGLNTENLCDIIQTSPKQIYNAIDIINRHILKRDENYYTLEDYHFKEYIKSKEEYKDIFKKINTDIKNWLVKKIDTLRFEDMPIYALRNAGFYLHDHDLFQAKLQKSWLDYLQYRIDSRFECQEIITQIWLQIESSDSQNTNILVINLIYCSLMLASLNSLITPELLIEFAKRNLLNTEYIKGYAQLYNVGDKILITNHLERGRLYETNSNEMKELQDLDEIQLITSSNRKRYESIKWLSKYETYIHSSHEREKLDAFLQPTPHYTETNRSSMEHQTELLKLIDKLSSHESLDGPINNTNLSSILMEINDAWLHESPNSHWQIISRISRILRPLSVYSRANILYTLELLAPALQKHLGKDITNEVKQAVKLFIES